MTNQTLTIPIDAIERDFEDFFSPASNTRIIFSGPFGIGKTYFLDKFFKSRSQKYLPIFLRPVNYSLLSNEDVFRLIKYDILFQIIKDRQFIFDDIPDFTKMEFAQFFASQNLFLPLVNLLKTLPKIKTLVTGAEEIEKLITKYSEGLRQINKNEKLCVLSEFRTEAETNFFLEYDQVSQLIADQLDEIAEKDGLQKVLIIDDLDRLDPEHIFRLFNVFSAHFDLVNYYPNGEEIKDNKFGFDKIVFVCDIDNIRKIFAHKYGEGVDFSGYIDKFYSSQIYHFNKDKTILKYIEEIFKPYENNYPQKGGSQSSILSVVKLIFRDLIEAKCVNHRIIQNITEHKIRFREPYSISFWSPAYVRNYEFIFIQVLDFLYDIFGKNYEALYEAIGKTLKLKKCLANKYINKQIIHMLPLLSLEDLEGDSIRYWKHPQFNEAISFQIEHGMDDLYYATTKSQFPSWINNQYYSLLLLVFETLKNIGVFTSEPE